MSDYHPKWLKNSKNDNSQWDAAQSSIPSFTEIVHNPVTNFQCSLLDPSYRLSPMCLIKSATASSSAKIPAAAVHNAVCPYRWSASQICSLGTSKLYSKLQEWKTSKTNSRSLLRCEMLRVGVHQSTVSQPPKYRYIAQPLPFTPPLIFFVVFATVTARHFCKYIQIGPHSF